MNLLSFKEYSLLESFDIVNVSEKRLKCDDIKKVLMQRATQQGFDINIAINWIDDILKNTKQQFAYIKTFEKHSYMFIYFDKDSKKEFHFIYLDDLKNGNLKINKLSKPLKLFSYQLSIAYKFMLKGDVVKIIAPIDGSNSRIVLYEKIIKKVLKKYNLNYEWININENEITLLPKDSVTFPGLYSYIRRIEEGTNDTKI